jgi:hypothetical protein
MHLRIPGRIAKEGRLDAEIQGAVLDGKPWGSGGGEA